MTAGAGEVRFAAYARSLCGPPEKSLAGRVIRLSLPKSQPDLDLDASLLCSLAAFEDEVRSRFEDAETAKAVWALANRFAELLHEDASTLAGTDVAGFWSSLRDPLANHDLGEELEYGLQARLAWALLASF